jgi:hypothetical protein
VENSKVNEREFLKVVVKWPKGVEDEWNTNGNEGKEYR